MHALLGLGYLTQDNILKFHLFALVQEANAIFTTECKRVVTNDEFIFKPHQSSGGRIFNDQSCMTIISMGVVHCFRCERSMLLKGGSLTQDPDPVSRGQVNLP